MTMLKVKHMTQTEIDTVDTLKMYGCPPDLAAHLRKLGEEVGELAEAIANDVKPGFYNNPNHVDKVISEIGDVAMVLTSMLQAIARREYSLLDLLRTKTNELMRRMHEGRYDRRYGPGAISYDQAVNGDDSRRIDIP